MIYLLQSASRDEREFPDPDAFRWNREIRCELSFGRGQKFCICVHLARLEGRILLEGFLSDVDDYEIDIDATVRLPSSFQLGWNSLPVDTAQPGMSPVADVVRSRR